LKRKFLFGRVQNLNVNSNYSTVEPVNLRIIFSKPFQFFHYTTGEPITFVNQDHGIILADSFLLGSFTVVLPINTNSIVVMNTTMGTIIIELYEDKMPITTANFIKLTNDGFYDGLVFHRVIEDFVIQGGGYYPNGTEKISPYGPIDLEINPSVHHLDGTIGMARTNDPNSATSQFFIDDGAQRHLEPNGSDPYGYAAFGRVVKGIDVVRAIAQVETMTKYGVMEDWPVDDVIIESVTIVRS
jgi:cyclophilin family peptidyl-prolyl cis-trans isomerase